MQSSSIYFNKYFITVGILGLLYQPTLHAQDAASNKDMMNASATSCKDINGTEITAVNRADLKDKDGNALFNPANCGNGVLDPGECCDLGSNNKPETTGKHPSGCLDTCLIAAQWNCNTPEAGAKAQDAAVTTMNDLYNKLTKFWLVPANVKRCSASVDSSKRAGEKLNYDKNKEQALGGDGSNKLVSCLDYEAALDRFLGYNSSTPIDASIYKSKAVLGYQGKKINFNNKLCVGKMYSGLPAGVNVKVETIDSNSCPDTPNNI